MHRILGLLGAILFLCAVGPSDALARRSTVVLPIFVFGQSDELICRKEVALTGDAGEPLCLSEYNVYTYFFAGIFTTSETVLAAKFDNSYYLLPTGEELADLQEAGLLPNPIPSFQRPVLDYLHGYSLWLLLLVVGAIALLVKLVRRRSAASPSPVTTEELFHSALKRVLISAMLSDGAISESERRAVSDIYERVAGFPLADAELDAAITKVMSDPSGLKTTLSKLAPSLTTEGKDLLFRAAILIVGIDQKASDGEHETLAEVADALAFTSEDMDRVTKSLHPA